MTRRLLDRRASGAPGDDGVALVVAIALIGIVAMLAVTLVTVSLSESRSTGRDRQRSVAVMTAEGQVDALVAAIQSTVPASLPCGTTTGTQTVAPDVLAVTNQVTYADAGGSALDCEHVRARTVTPSQVLVRSTARPSTIAGMTPVSRTLETLLRLVPSYGDDLDKAVYGTTGVTFENNGSLRTATGAPDADIYTDGSFVCSGNQQYAGSIYAQRSVRLDSSCAVAVDVHAGWGIHASHPQARVGGTALAGGGSALAGGGTTAAPTDDRSIVIDGHLGQYARATGTASGSACTPSTKCVSNTSVVPPPRTSFPRLVWDSATQARWQQAAPAGGGFTNVVRFPEDHACAGPGKGDKYDAVGGWLKDNASVLPANTVVVAHCPGIPVFQSGVDLALSRDVAVFSSAGFVLDGNPVVRSGDAVQRKLYLIQPWGVACTTQPGISVGNNVRLASSVEVLLYSPCDVDKRNNSEMTGQIYAGGTAHLRNSTDITFKALKVWGVAAGSAVEHYDVEILYKRESR